MIRRLPIVLLVAACGPTTNASLADLPGLTVNVALVSMDDTDADDSSPQQVEIDLGYDKDAFRAANGGDCATLGDAEARFLGTSMGLAFAGSDYESSDCATPYFRETMNVPSRAGATSLVITDSTTSIAAEFPSGAIEARVATLTSHPAWSFREGDTVTLAWSHPADLAAVAADQLEIWWHRDDGQSFELENASHDATTITATIPPGEGANGEGSIYTIVGRYGDVAARGMATACTGAVRCEYTVYLKYDHRAKLAP